MISNAQDVVEHFSSALMFGTVGIGGSLNLGRNNTEISHGLLYALIHGGMTRFKELRRIEAAIKHKHTAELQWALGYCQMRLQIAPRKDHQKHWRHLENKVRQALENAK